MQTARNWGLHSSRNFQNSGIAGASGFHANFCISKENLMQTAPDWGFKVPEFFKIQA